MMTMLRGALVYENGAFVKRDMLLDGASLTACVGDVSPSVSVVDNTVITLTLSVLSNELDINLFPLN